MFRRTVVERYNPNSLDDQRHASVFSWAALAKKAERESPRRSASASMASSSPASNVMFART